eukprot:gb/GECH01011012.1/.p1 GENE.gb/GECH01011012.1/~~gb/GECH01011012.1/.p1  ORF type:complete len:128 (+),score=9.89 gb/GECH01011012.1/:1-384(+)
MDRGPIDVWKTIATKKGKCKFNIDQIRNKINYIRKKQTLGQTDFQRSMEYVKSLRNTDSVLEPEGLPFEMMTREKFAFVFSRKRFRQLASKMGSNIISMDAYFTSNQFLFPILVVAFISKISKPAQS